MRKEQVVILRMLFLAILLMWRREGGPVRHIVAIAAFSALETDVDVSGEIFHTVWNGPHDTLDKVWNIGYWVRSVDLVGRRMGWDSFRSLGYGIRRLTW
jgi:hypothetical protein